MCTAPLHCSSPSPAPRQSPCSSILPGPHPTLPPLLLPQAQPHSEVQLPPEVERLARFTDDPAALGEEAPLTGLAALWRYQGL